MLTAYAKMTFVAATKPCSDEDVEKLSFSAEPCSLTLLPRRRDTDNSRRRTFLKSVPGAAVAEMFPVFPFTPTPIIVMRTADRIDMNDTMELDA